MTHKGYFNYASTTPVDPEVLKVYNEVSIKYFQNNQSDLEVQKLLKTAKDKILKLLKLDDSYEVIFTSSGTEANNLAIVGSYKEGEPKHFITSTIEHPSVLASFKELERLGHKVTYINPNNKGNINVEDIISEIKKNTVLISIMTINNEVGSLVFDPSDAKKIKKEYPNIKIHSDSIQSIGKIKLNYSDFDMVSFSSHKIYAPKGVGVLIKNKNINLKPIMFGAEGSLRPGTQCVGLQVAFVNALNKVITNEDKEILENNKIRDYIIEELKGTVVFNGNSVSNILSFQIPTKLMSESIVTYFAAKGFSLSTRSSCSHASKSSSHVLIALGLTQDEINHTIRLSFNSESSKSEIDEIIKEIKKLKEDKS